MLLIAASVAETPTRLANAQMGQIGQSAMAPVGGIVNQAMGRLANLEENGPGWMYYGINAADRGLGYRGSYYTIGGFIPYAEDDLGGIWSADLRTHLSNYGGFFSNVGAVRKQFFGGSLFGVGVYWDYDGDQSQYSNTTIRDDSGSYVFAGGQTYQQVGVSAEWLTDYGNIRSNGYIPCGSTAQVMGPFVGNSFLCQNGINAALAGTDLEIGAYLPGLADWAGMVSVGGYAYGNSRYNLINGQNVIPWFGGVYTRLDLTLIKNWDFSLQANNDSFFDWTGFARLTYRMGGSRRRNVPEQMEQPMFRNEHIVRAHQTPEQAINPATGTPWKVIHVDNSLSVADGGSGTWERPVKTLQAAQGIATKEYDIVFVRVGDSLNCPYDTNYVTVGATETGYHFSKENQYLVGEGTSLQLCTANCGLVPLWTTSASTVYPVITNSVGPAVVVDQNGSHVDHLSILGAAVGISDGSGMKQSDGVAYVNDVRITGNGATQTGVVISDQTGDSSTANTFNFSNMKLDSLTADGFVVDGRGVGNPYVNLSNSTINNTSGSAVVVNATTGEGRLRLVDSTIDGTTAPGILVTGANAIVERVTIKNVGNYGVSVAGTPVLSGTAVTSGSSTVQITNSNISANIAIQATAPNAGDLVNITISNNNLSSPEGGNGINMAVSSGTINANIIGNRISGLATTAYYTGTAGGVTNPATLASNIYLTTTDTTAGLKNLTIKAVGPDNLAAINRNASIATYPKPNPVNTGTNAPVLVPPPPPPNYDPAIFVPLPFP